MCRHYNGIIVCGYFSYIISNDLIEIFLKYDPLRHWGFTKKEAGSKVVGIVGIGGLGTMGIKIGNVFSIFNYNLNYSLIYKYR